jgi:cation diffusion facilitator family transporter
VVAGVLAVEVARNAVGALADRAYPRTDWLLVAALGGKAAAKAGVMWAAGRLGRRGASPAMDALRVDARNDVLVCLVSIVGFFGARHGWPILDALIALPVAAWIAASGVQLARDNIRLLMGEAPPEPRQQEIVSIAGAVPGVRKAHRIRAHFVGTLLHVHVIIVVDPGLSVRQAHDIGEAVRIRVEAEADVGHCSVHIDIE